ncbi:Octamer-binding transcription factor [Parasponia andersonii]|uniref:Octamer-binding transcription factor n=1 Tax=Parasponia andersonii TaxID=3476 RepID=A0A2P5APY8_PARAD|nr:Octamer-binding transcription factor [Parasponia andersonii]
MMDCGFNDYPEPEVPRSCRSARGRGPITKRWEGNRKHSCEILASVAGNLLEKGDNSLHTDASCGKNLHDACDSVISKKEVDEGQFLNEELLELGSSLEKAFGCNPGFQSFCNPDKFNSEINPMSKDFRRSGLLNSNKKKAFDDSNFVPDVIGGKVLGVPERKVEAEPTELRNQSVKDKTMTVTCGLEDLMKLEGKQPELVGPGCNVHTASVRVVSRDDDESSFGSAYPSTMVKALGPPLGTGNKRIKKISDSSHWRVAPDVDGNYSSTDGKVKEVCCEERIGYTQENTQKIYPFKKRKFFNQDFSTSNRGSNRDGTFDSSDKRINGKQGTAAIGGSSSMTGQHVFPNSKECNVKLSIKSFKVPELLIDIPTTETVGSLKRMVMDAVTSILGEGLHVGILVQGKKVKDDNKTLVQTGISQYNKHSNLGFILEPEHSQTATSPFTKNESLLSRIKSQALTRHSVSLSGSVESDFNATPALGDNLSNNTNNESKALIPVPRISMEALAVVPFHRKSGHHEYLKRRIRRPFSVSEVEALVRAVEKLGTGRWRDVKFHAFDNAKHRTYVDLKDKWKTLVHTARISPQQRRGEPVPQGLLDRVLAAQATGHIGSRNKRPK